MPTSAESWVRAFGILGKHRLLDEQQAERLEQAGELLRHRPVDAAVEIEADVHALGLRGLHPLGHLFEPSAVR